MSTKMIIACSFLFLLIALIIACQGENEIKKAQFYANGKSLYAATCQNCHGDKGEGLGNLYPPLSDTAFLRKNRKNLSCFVKYGIHKELLIDNRTFDTEMPANPTLTAQEIAYILTYIGNSFGNELGLLSTEEVNASLKICSKVAE